MSNLEQLTIDMKESLEREMRQEFGKLHGAIEDLGRGFDAQAVRLDRHAAPWQTGSRWSSKMDAWAEKMDQQMQARVKEIAELRERLEKLEGPDKSQNQ